MTSSPSSTQTPWREELRDFFHAPVDIRVVAAVRIGYALLMLINVICWWPDLDRWFSDSGALTLVVSRQLSSPTCLTVFQFLPADSWTVRVVYAVFVAQLVGLLIGWKPRFQAICCQIWLVSFQHRNGLLFEGEDTLFRIIGFLLIFMPTGGAWSIQSWQAARNGVPAAQTFDGWSVRLLQLEMTMLFFSAAWSKYLGAPWRNGTALYYVMRLDEYWGRFPLPTVVLETPWIIALLTWSTMALEFAIPVLIWFTPTRRYAFLLLLIFHLGCDYAMHLFLFHWIMLVGWMSFLTADDFRWNQHQRRTQH